MSTTRAGGADILESFSGLASAFAKKELTAAREAHDRFPFAPFWSDVLEKAIGVGFFGITLPAGYGGLGLDADALVPVVRMLARADASLSALVCTHAAALQVIAESAGDTGADPAYRMIGKSPGKPLAFQSFTHPDELEMPVAVSDGDAYRLTGSVRFLAAGAVADFAVVAGSGGRSGEFSYYLIALNTGAVSVSEPIFTLGLHACPVVDARLDDALGILLGKKGGGIEYCRRAWPRLSLASAAIPLGILEGSLDEAKRYAEERVQGGRVIIEWPEVRMILARIAGDVHVAHGALAEACRMFAANEPGWEAASVAAALSAGEAAARGTVDGVQVLGGNGYMTDYGQEKRMRDAKQAQFLLGMPALRRLELMGLPAQR
ncbi:MAG: acyl-CoA dehydrogenase [Spirochaetes bacterium]|nr:MAG: acyl-CoA dehydrogenase [Spirochaetota bacterium]